MRFLRTCSAPESLGGLDTSGSCMVQRLQGFESSKDAYERSGMNLTCNTSGQADIGILASMTSNLFQWFQLSGRYHVLSTTWVAGELRSGIEGVVYASLGRAELQNLLGGELMPRPNPYCHVRKGQCNGRVSSTMTPFLSSLQQPHCFYCPLRGGQTKKNSYLLHVGTSEKNYGLENFRRRKEESSSASNALSLAGLETYSKATPSPAFWFRRTSSSAAFTTRVN
ncbi:hypothetical protein BJY00DRAFT_180741 [Aspergillus carlsbadensis]|nr:hypothetical protein BJY00DRAFT_180741 [Aspergillus carlsbadensis]